jgi:hypothetical protein
MEELKKIAEKPFKIEENEEDKPTTNNSYIHPEPLPKSLKFNKDEDEDIIMCPYKETAKTFAVFFPKPDKSIIEQLKKIRGKFNPHLTFKISSRPGWFFPWNEKDKKKSNWQIVYELMVKISSNDKPVEIPNPTLEDKEIPKMKELKILESKDYDNGFLKKGNTVEIITSAGTLKFKISSVKSENNLIVKSGEDEATIVKINGNWQLYGFMFPHQVEIKKDKER